MFAILQLVTLALSWFTPDIYRGIDAVNIYIANLERGFHVPRLAFPVFNFVRNLPHQVLTIGPTSDKSYFDLRPQTPVVNPYVEFHPCDDDALICARRFLTLDPYEMCCLADEITYGDSSVNFDGASVAIDLPPFIMNDSPPSPLAVFVFGCIVGMVLLVSGILLRMTHSHPFHAQCLFDPFVWAESIYGPQGHKANKEDIPFPLLEDHPSNGLTSVWKDVQSLTTSRRLSLTRPHRRSSTRRGPTPPISPTFCELSAITHSDGPSPTPTVLPELQLPPVASTEPGPGTREDESPVFRVNSDPSKEYLSVPPSPHEEEGHLPFLHNTQPPEVEVGLSMDTVTFPEDEESALEHLVPVKLDKIELVPDYHSPDADEAPLPWEFEDPDVTIMLPESPALPEEKESGVCETKESTESPLPEHPVLHPEEDTPNNEAADVPTVSAPVAVARARTESLETLPVDENCDNLLEVADEFGLSMRSDSEEDWDDDYDALQKEEMAIIDKLWEEELASNPRRPSLIARSPPRLKARDKSSASTPKQSPLRVVSGSRSPRPEERATKTLSLEEDQLAYSELVKLEEKIMDSVLAEEPPAGLFNVDDGFSSLKVRKSNVLPVEEKLPAPPIPPPSTNTANPAGTTDQPSAIDQVAGGRKSLLARRKERGQAFPSRLERPALLTIQKNKPPPSPLDEDFRESQISPTYGIKERSRLSSPPSSMLSPSILSPSFTSAFAPSTFTAERNSTAPHTIRKSTSNSMLPPPSRIRPPLSTAFNGQPTPSLQRASSHKSLHHDYTLPREVDDDNQSLLKENLTPLKPASRIPKFGSVRYSASGGVAGKSDR